MTQAYEEIPLNQYDNKFDLNQNIFYNNILLLILLYHKDWFFLFPKKKKKKEKKKGKVGFDSLIWKNIKTKILTFINQFYLHQFKNIL